MSQHTRWADPNVLEARVRNLDSEGLAAFVTDLWAARGFETDRDGMYITARRDRGTRVMYILTGGAATQSVDIDRPVDAVVAAGHPERGETLASGLGARVVNAADLTEMLRYAVDRSVAADLTERHLGAAPGELTFPLRDRVRRAVVRVDIETVVVGVVVLVVVAAVMGAGLGLAGPGVASDGPTGEAVVTTTNPTSPAGTEPATATVEAESTPTGSAGDPSAVPGVSAAGIRNASRLGQAHAGTVTNMSSYTIWFDYYTTDNRSTGEVKRDVNVRVDAEEIAVQTIREGTGGTRSPVRTSYFTGTNWYTAENVTDDFSRSDNRTPTATPRAVPFTRPGEMVQKYVATAETVVSVADRPGVEAGQRYRVQGTGRPAGLSDAVTDYEMTAVVDERGFVWMLNAEFSVVRDTDDDGVTERTHVRLTWTYDRLGTTDIGLNT